MIVKTRKKSEAKNTLTPAKVFSKFMHHLRKQLSEFNIEMGLKKKPERGEDFRRIILVDGYEVTVAVSEVPRYRLSTEDVRYSIQAFGTAAYYHSCKQTFTQTTKDFRPESAAKRLGRCIIRWKAEHHEWQEKRKAETAYRVAGEKLVKPFVRFGQKGYRKTAKFKMEKETYEVDIDVFRDKIKIEYEIKDQKHAKRVLAKLKKAGLLL